MNRFRSFFALLLALALALAAVPGVAEEFSTKDVKKVAAAPDLPWKQEGTVLPGLLREP